MAMSAEDAVPLFHRQEVSRPDRVHVRAEISALMRVDSETAFDFVTAEDVLPKILTGYGWVPGVTHTSELTDDWREPGASRLVHLKGGGTVREEMVECLPPHRFEYIVRDFTISLKRLVWFGVGSWVFTPVEGGVLIHWTYTFRARSGLAAWLLTWIVRVHWLGYMRQALVHMDQLLALGRSPLAPTSCDEVRQP